MPTEPSIAHRVHFSDLAGLAAHPDRQALVGTVLQIDGPEAHHAARVKRLRAGESIALFDGAGLVARARVVDVGSGKHPTLSAELVSVEQHPPVTPRIEVWCPPPKGDRIEVMIDQLSQIGVAAWRPLQSERSERDRFREDRLHRQSIESAKQCGRAHLLEIGAWATLVDALGDPRAIFADAGGEPGQPTSSDAVLVVGPEGGWSDDERARVHASGRAVSRYGSLVMRLETAAVVAAGVLLAQSAIPSPTSFDGATA